MFFGIDIDNTIATDTNAYARYITRHLQLPIPESQLAELTYFGEFQQLPQVKAYVRQSPEHKRRIEQVTDEADNAVEILMGLDPIPGAREALLRLAHLGSIHYLTCRTPDQIALSQAWLHNHDFPAADHVSSCQHYHYKFIHAAQYADSDEPIILVNDMAFRLIQFFPRLLRDHKTITKSTYKRLAIIGYNCTTTICKHPTQFPLRRVSFPPGL